MVLFNASSAGSTNSMIFFLARRRISATVAGGSSRCGLKGSGGGSGNKLLTSTKYGALLTQCKGCNYVLLFQTLSK